MTAIDSLTSDLVRRFIFEDADIRGEIAVLEQSYQEVLARHQYPAIIQHLLGEFVAAASILSTTLKFEGTLSIQARGKGDISLLLAECTSQQTIRAIAHHSNTPKDSDLRNLLQEGQIAITIDPKQGQRYQGIIPLEGETLAHCLEDYFRQSEQLETRIWLCANGKRAAGLLLQGLPSQLSNTPEDFQNHWERITHLSSTVTEDELLTLHNETLLHRLYHEETVRLFDPNPVSFKCTCSRERTTLALKSLGQEEANKIIEKKQKITVDCQFCGHRYSFEKSDIDTIFKPDTPTLH